jgi:hypothetical protein
METQSTTPAVKLPKYITLSSLCDRHGIDTRHARMKLRKAGFRPSPSGVWEWDRADESLSWILVELLKRP